MGCTSSLAADDAEYTEAPRVLEKASRGDFEAKFSVGQVLGKGGFSRVWAARRRSDGARLAVKTVSLGSSRSSLGALLEDMESLVSPSNNDNKDNVKDMSMKEVVGELAAWSAVQGNKHVVNLVSAMVESGLVYVVMERCECDILRKIADSPRFWRLESRRMLKEMLLGVEACHSVDIVHRDIKPANFLLGADGSTVKLCDFGLAVRMPRRRQLREVAGTPQYMSPEMLNGSGYGKTTDMWSYGVTAYGLCFFEFPFECDDEKPLPVQAMKKAIEQNLAPRCLENGGGMAAFIRPLLEPCKSARCTVEAALVHWYLQEDASASQSSSVSPRTPQPRCSSTASEASTQVGPNFEQAAAKARDSTNTCCSTPSLLDDASWSV